MSKGHIPYNSIFIPHSKNDSYSDGEQTTGCQELGMVRSDGQMWL